MTVDIVTKNGNFRVSDDIWHNIFEVLKDSRNKGIKTIFIDVNEDTKLEEDTPCFLHLKDIKYVYYTNEKNDDADVISKKPNEDKQTVKTDDAQIEKTEAKPLGRICPYPYCPWEHNRSISIGDPNPYSPYEPTITCNAKAKNASSICKTKL